jgi:hypothetical protein
MDPVLGRVAVELQQRIEIVDDLGHRFGVLGAAVDFEGLDRDLGVVEVGRRRRLTRHTHRAPQPKPDRADGGPSLATRHAPPPNWPA